MSKANSKKTFALSVLAAVSGLAAASGVVSASVQANDGPAVNVELGRELFDAWSCSACHTLTDAGSSGVIGPSLDNPKLTRDLIIGRVSNGQGAMPSFGGQISDEEIATLADYIVAANHPAK